ncbi:MAG: endonuclease MutS2 [Clostridiales bacterium]|nr:endonuclease MutS2 [Clostridiales bacterium]
MNKHYKTLELDKILDMLAKEIPCDEGAAMALDIEPSHDIGEVRYLLKQTYDAHMLIGRFGSPSMGGLKNITSPLRRAEAGSVLMMSELLQISRVLAVIRNLKEWKSRSAGIETVLDSYFSSLVPNKYLEEKINYSILSDEEMSDNASKELANIRKKIRSSEAKARQQLDRIIHSDSQRKYLQDSIVTIRSGRFVVPVKAECRGNIPGLVHDTSASGATVFIEPMSVVEANNEIRVLKSKEQIEIERIMAELSAEAGSFAQAIINSIKAAAEVSVIFGKANLAYKMNAVLPDMNDESIIYLNKARHPLIDKNKVVPMTIELGNGFDTLVITGPNTGGKTVSLKLVGLLTLMAMCGLMIPAEDNSKLCVFDNVLADIGDEQGIEQSLSTFSSHITNIIDILKIADEKSLILIDELGSGTDPVEGAALATAIIEKIRNMGASLCVTTHYAELKSYALNTPGVENASCEFDVNTLRPTYRLLIGLPGKSNAFAISERLGIDKAITKRAEELISAEDRSFENVVGQLQTKRQALDDSIEQARSEAALARAAKEKAEQELARIKETTKKQIEQAEEKARAIVEKTEREAYDLLDELDALSKAGKSISPEEKARLRAQINALSKNETSQKKNSNEGYILPRKIKPGDTVLMTDIDKKASVIEVNEQTQTLYVQAGIFKTRVPISDVRLVEEPNVTVKATKSIKKQVDIKAMTDVDLRGMTADEAIMVLDNAIDSAVLSGIHQLTVIHGKGTGVLRREVQNFLRHHKAIKSFRLGVYGEGESGVTIAELK